MWLLVSASCAAAYYAAYTKLMGMTWMVPGIYTGIIVMYLLGLFLKDKVDVEEEQVDVEQVEEVEQEYQALKKKQKQNEVEDEGDNG